MVRLYTGANEVYERLCNLPWMEAVSDIMNEYAAKAR